MKRARPIPYPRRHTSFAVSSVADEITQSRLRRPDLARPFHGVRSHEVNLSEPFARIVAYSRRMLPGHAFSHSTAAHIYRVPLPLELEFSALVHESVARPSQPTRAAGAVGHRHPVGAPPFRTYRRLRVTDPATTWCQLARQLSHYDLVAAGDYLVSGRVTDDGREPPLSSIPALVAAVAGWRHHPGYSALMRALPRIRTGVDSRPETHLRLVLVDSGLPEPVVNIPIFERGRRLGKPDLAYPWARLVFEYQGGGHTDPQQHRRDIHRKETFEAHQHRVMEVMADDLTTGRADFLNRLNKILSQQAQKWPNLVRPCT